MKVNCPRCDLDILDLTLELIESGTCPTCDGQVYFGHFGERSHSIKGMLFEPGCNVAIPFEVVNGLPKLDDDEPTLTLEDPIGGGDGTVDEFEVTGVMPFEEVNPSSPKGNPDEVEEIKKVDDLAEEDE